MTIRVRVVLLAFVASVALAAAPAAADQTYILTAAKWGKAQTDAVVAAGGFVTFSHEASGLAVATSGNPDFLQNILSSRKISGAWPDMVLSLPSSPRVELAASAVDPTGDFLFDLQWALTAVGAPEAWGEGCTGVGVRVAILDGGINYLHPDLVTNFDVGASKSFYRDEEGEIIPFNQDEGEFWHGAHVAGIVAAADNETGVVGIAPHATIFAVKVLHGEDGSGPISGVIEGILYAATPLESGGGGADVINLSLGMTGSKQGGAGGVIGALAKAVNFADRSGVLVVAAAGNDGLDLDHSGPVTTLPAESGSAIAVSATGPIGFVDGATNFRSFASYSNYGNSLVWVAAPGGDFQYYPNDFWYWDMVLSTTKNSWGWAAGTSQAAPAVSAIAALAISSHPGISLGKLKTLIQRSADDEGDKGHDPFYGHGFVNAYKACTAK